MKLNVIARVAGLLFLFGSSAFAAANDVSAEAAAGGDTWAGNGVEQEKATSDNSIIFWSHICCGLPGEMKFVSLQLVSYEADAGTFWAYLVRYAASDLRGSDNVEVEWADSRTCPQIAGVIEKLKATKAPSPDIQPLPDEPQLLEPNYYVSSGDGPQTYAFWRLASGSYVLTRGTGFVSYIRDDLKTCWSKDRPSDLR